MDLRGEIKKKEVKTGKSGFSRWEGEKKGDWQQHIKHRKSWVQKKGETLW